MLPGSYSPLGGEQVSRVLSQPTFPRAAPSCIEGKPQEGWRQLKGLNLAPAPYHLLLLSPPTLTPFIILIQSLLGVATIIPQKDRTSFYHVSTHHCSRNEAQRHIHRRGFSTYYRACPLRWADIRGICNQAQDLKLAGSYKSLLKRYLRKPSVDSVPTSLRSIWNMESVKERFQLVSRRQSFLKPSDAESLELLLSEKEKPKIVWGRHFPHTSTVNLDQLKFTIVETTPTGKRELNLCTSTGTS